jgi:hypothetical protein
MRSQDRKRLADHAMRRHREIQHQDGSQKADNEGLGI